MSHKPKKDWPAFGGNSNNNNPSYENACEMWMVCQVTLPYAKI
jgi:hypothetical protein